MRTNNDLVQKRLGPKRLGAKTSRAQNGLGPKRPVTLKKSGVPSGTILFAYIIFIE